MGNFISPLLSILHMTVYSETWGFRFKNRVTFKEQVSCHFQKWQRILTQSFGTLKKVQLAHSLLEKKILLGSWMVSDWWFRYVKEGIYLENCSVHGKIRSVPLKSVGYNLSVGLLACVPSPFSPVRLCDPVQCSLPGCSVHEILQARILEWVATPFSWGSSRPRDRTHASYVSCIGRQILYC